jgi:hypothetical protein
MPGFGVVDGHTVQHAPRAAQPPLLAVAIGVSLVVTFQRGRHRPTSPEPRFMSHPDVADHERFFPHALGETFDPAQPAGSFAEAALHDYYSREKSLICDFIRWQSETQAEPNRLNEFGLAITGEVVSGGVCAVLRHADGGSLSSGPVMLNTNNEDPYQAAFAQAARLLLVVVR